MMNSKIFLRTTMGVLATIAIFAFSHLAMSEEAQEYSPPDPQQLARGAKAWAENCNRCHNLRDPKELQDYEWYVSVTHMRVLAGLPGDMARDIRAYLMSSN